MGLCHFVHLENEHLIHSNTPMQDFGEANFVCAVTLNMRFLNSREEIVSFKFIANIYRCIGKT